MQQVAPGIGWIPSVGQTNELEPEQVPGFVTVVEIGAVPTVVVMGLIGVDMGVVVIPGVAAVCKINSF